MHYSEPVSARKATARVVKIIDSIYEKSDVDKVSLAAVQLDKYQRKHL